AELFQDHLHDPLALLDVLHFAAFEQHVDEDLVLVLQELAGLVDFRFDVVITRLGTQPNLLELLMVGFGFVLGFLLLQELELAEVHDLADRGTLGGGNLDEVEPGFARHFQRLRGGNDADLLTLGPNETHRADADLLVDALMVATVIWSEAVGSRRRQERVLLSFESDPSGGSYRVTNAQGRLSTVDDDTRTTSRQGADCRLSPAKGRPCRLSLPRKGDFG